MNKKAIFVVIYASYYSEIYTESTICFSQEEANKKFEEYISDVCESEGMEFDKDEYAGTTEFEHTNERNGHTYNVKIEGHEVADNDTDLICAFFQMLQNKTPNRFDAADEEHFTEVVQRELDYLDETNEYGNVPY